MNRMPRPRRSRLFAVAMVAVALVLSGCAGSAPAPIPTRTAGAAGSVQVWLHQERADEPRRTARIRVVNGSEAALDIAGVRLSDDRLDAVITAEGVRLPTEESVDLAADLPPVSCDDGDARRSWELALADGTVLRGDLVDSLGFLDRLHDRECLALAVAASVRLTWREAELPASGTAVLPLEITPTGAGEAVRVLAVQSTPLLQFGAGVTVLTIPDGARRVDVPLVPQRCDPHVVQEDKRGTVFTVEVEVDGSRGTIELPVSEDERGRILSWVAERCDFGG
jgi:hypothetical protein